MFGTTVTLASPGLKHVLLPHPELRGIRKLENLIVSAVEAPEFVVSGRHGEHIAVRRVDVPRFEGKYLVVAYDEDGEVRTAFITGKIEKILRRPILWKP